MLLLRLLLLEHERGFTRVVTLVSQSQGDFWGMAINICGLYQFLGVLLVRNTSAVDT